MHFRQLREGDVAVAGSGSWDVNKSGKRAEWPASLVYAVCGAYAPFTRPRSQAASSRLTTPKRTRQLPQTAR